ncbi:MAG: bifunctional riboflavin kinase/FAD synthetase [Ruminococcaceae bacterium]|nr:bifunctional riboflavin kinase/FAD synthetase [Oscillospiraceae bacterium]
MKQKIFALGFFDGVHLGHQALLEECCRLAAERKAMPCALTFDLPPSAVLQNTQPNMINTEQDRAALLRQYGIGPIYTYTANEENLSTPWQAFLEQLAEYDSVGFVCGEDYRFGRGGEGNAETLAKFAAQRGLSCVIVPEQRLDGEKISSTRIRELLEKGDVENANRLLGHPHILTETVVSGQKLGRTIGIPTANLHLRSELVTPAFGVYACIAVVEGHRYVAVTNIGTRPTVNGEGVTVEPWLLDFSGDLYGKEITLEFHKFLRPERKFDSLAELKVQIQEDAARAYKLLK